LYEVRFNAIYSVYSPQILYIKIHAVVFSMFVCICSTFLGIDILFSLLYFRLYIHTGEGYLTDTERGTGLKKTMNDEKHFLKTIYPFSKSLRTTTSTKINIKAT